jgi:hypothetical protein
MVIVETVALSIMVCNSIVLPLLLRSDNRSMWQDDFYRPHPADPARCDRRGGGAGLSVLPDDRQQRGACPDRTGVICCHRAVCAGLSSSGLIWSRGNAKGAMAGLLAGFAIWAYTLLMPLFADAGFVSQTILSQGPGGIDWLRPRALFGSDMDPLTHGVVWSMTVNGPWSMQRFHC